MIIGTDTTFFGDGKIEIGDNVVIGANTLIFAIGEGGVTIGNNVSIAAHCYIIDSNHGIKANMLIREQNLEAEKIEIGDDVWIGAGCQIIKGAKLGNGVVIGAGSIVNRHIEDNGIAVGNPAKIIKYRS